MPSFMSISAHPMTPRPIFLLPLCIFSISETGYVFTSIALSRNRTDVKISSARCVKSILSIPPFFFAFDTGGDEPVTYFDTSIEPRTHASKGNNGCSPHGLVDTIVPTWGVGLALFIVSMKMIPGSPVSHALSTISSNTVSALIFPAVSPLLGFMRLYVLWDVNASMKASVTATEMLKFVNWLFFRLTRINSRISG